MFAYRTSKTMRCLAYFIFTKAACQPSFTFSARF